MEVVAVVWTPSGAAQAGLLSKTMDAQEKSMGNPGGPGASGSAAVANPNAPIAAPVRAGPTSNPSDF